MIQLCQKMMLLNLLITLPPKKAEPATATTAKTAIL